MNANTKRKTHMPNPILINELKNIFSIGIDDKIARKTTEWEWQTAFKLPCLLKTD